METKEIRAKILRRFDGIWEDLYKIEETNADPLHKELFNQLRKRLTNVEQLAAQLNWR